MSDEETYALALEWKRRAEAAEARAEGLAEQVRQLKAWSICKDAVKRAEAAEKRVKELEKRLQTLRGVASTWAMGDCDAQDVHDAVMDDQLTCLCAECTKETANVDLAAQKRGSDVLAAFFGMKPEDLPGYREAYGEDAAQANVDELVEIDGDLVVW